MKKTLRTASDLIDAKLAPEAHRAELEAVSARYVIAVPPTLSALIDPTDPNDPIARQFIPQAAELISQPEENADPIGDNSFSPVPGIVHRYPDRVLLKAIHVCPVYCRFCFRREMVGPNGDGNLSDEALDAALDYIRRHFEIWEVILTGGDPLLLSPRRLGRIAAALAEMDHVRILRIHSRVPVATPESVTDASINVLKQSGKILYVAIHANHPRELTPAMRAACMRLSQAGVTLLGQTVLLRGINDDAEILATLMRGFVEFGIRPYYLHHPDLAPGTAHFRLGIEEGQSIVAALRGRISGLCQPTYVLDIPGGHGKSPINTAYTKKSDAGGYQVQDYNGRWHQY